MAAAQTTPAAPAAGRTPIQTLAVGTAVMDSAGATIGTVDSITPQAVVINTGTAKIAVPPTSIGKTTTGFAMSMTKAALEAAQAQQQAQASAAVKAQLVAGTPVSGLQGNPLGTIKSADATTVTMTTVKGVDVKLPVTGFGAGPNGGIVLGMTAAQLDAATAGAVPSTPESAATSATATPSSEPAATETSTSSTTSANASGGATTTKTTTNKTTRTKR